MTPAAGHAAEAPGGRARRRRAARLAAAQALYQIEMMADEPERVILEFLGERRGLTLEDGEVLEIDGDFFADLVRGASRRRRELDSTLGGGLADGWRMERLEAVLRAILRLAAYELAARADIPAKVSINEYLEVAHAFLPVEQGRFVNAILDRIARQLRPAELVGKPDDRPADAR